MSRVRLGVVIGLVAVLAGAGVTVAAVVGNGSACWATIVPAYATPGEIVELAHGPRHPAMIIVNPASGPGARPQIAYRDAVTEAAKAGSQMLGYVSTQYGARPQADVLADAQRYQRWYGIDGIFLDETSHHSDELPYYRALTMALRAEGMKLLVINPGVVPAPGYFALADVVVTFEGPFADYRAALARTPPWVHGQPRSAIAHLVYAATPQDAAAVTGLNDHAGSIYVTSGQLPDPWGSAPGYRAAEGDDAADCGDVSRTG